MNKYLRIIAATLLIFYFSWELYWYLEVGLAFIKWHTHIMFPVYLFFFTFFMLKILKVPKKVLYILTLLFAGLVFTEIILVITGLTKTAQEKLNGYYASFTSLRENLPKTYYWVDDPGTMKHLRADEFHFTRKINAMGFSDVEWPVEKREREFRMLCLGDSFTEGDGAHTDSSYVAFLRKATQGQNVTVMNAGKCGSDPFFNYMNYKDRLAKYQPDLIIQTISSHDMSDDIYSRGGLERFKSGNKLVFRSENNFIEFFYAISYTSRIILKVAGYNELLVIPYDHHQHASEDRKLVLNLFKQYAALANKNKASIIVVVQPQKSEIENCYSTDMLKLIEAIGKNPQVRLCDLRDYYVTQMKIRKGNIADYYWQQNGHHNAKGYQLMADGIHEFLGNENIIR